MTGESLLHYRVAEKIGEGGMGAVYRATDTHLDRPVAIKVLPPDRVADVERKQRFVQEARAASALRHPNIVVIHDIASDGGRDFIVMEFVEGQPLDHVIGRKGLKLSETLGLAVQIADGLAKAHAAGIVHRDIKPSNIMVAGDGLVKILDFGLAKLTEEVPDAGTGPTLTPEPEGRPRTKDGYVLGTAAYMSPEQAEGKPVDARSDIFSFGAVLYEMLTGRKAFARESGIKTLAAVLSEEPPPLSAVNAAIPAEIERIVSRCLRKDRQRRWQTMSDLKVALQEIKEDSDSGRLPAAALPARGRTRRRVALAAAAVLLLIAAAAAVVRFAGRGPERAQAFEIIPLTFDPGLTGAPTLPADGTLMAYTSDRPGSQGLDIWVQPLSGGKPLRLTDHPADDWFPSFSPDGSQIAFRSERDGGGIYLIDALAAGSEPRRIADKGLVPRYSPDGQSIAYVVSPGSLDARLHKAYLVSPRGGEPRPVLCGFSFGYIFQGAAPVWSPDGTRLLFQGWHSGDPASADWWVTSVEGGEAVRTHAIENLALTSIVQFPVAWAGDAVYFVSGTTIEGIGLFRALIEPGSWTVKGPAEPITTGPGMRASASVTRDGQFVLTSMTAAMHAWSVAARPDTAEVSDTPQRLTQDLMQNFSPSVSRDGTRAAFTAFGGAAAGRFEIRVKDLTTGRETAIPARGAHIDQVPRLSPDGSLLAYRDLIDGTWRTFVVGPGSAPAREVCAGCLVVGFFPDNASALARTRPDALEKLDLRTGERAPLLSSGPDTIADAMLSTDGAWIAWLAGMPDGKAAIRVAPAGTATAAQSRPITVAEGDCYLSAPAWSPSDRWLYYLSEEGDRCALVARELDPGTKAPIGEERRLSLGWNSRLMLNFPRANGRIGVAADRIVFEATELRGNIYLARRTNR